MVLQFIPTPNGVNATEKLNHLMITLEGNSFSKHIDFHNSGFTLDPDARWCMTLKFINKSGFIALKESGDNIQMWIYKYKQSLEPIEYLIRDYKISHERKMIKLLEDSFKTIHSL